MKEEIQKNPLLWMKKKDKNNKYLKKPSIGMDMASYRSTSVLDDELGDDTVLLYKDMTELVYKVLDDIGIVNKRIQNELAEKMIHRERQNEQIKQRKAQLQGQKSLIPQGYILSQRMSISLARDAPNVKIGTHKKPKMENADKSKTTISISSAFATEDDATAYRKMKYDTDNDSDDDVYNIDKDRSNTLPVTNINGNKSSSMKNTAISEKSSIESALRKMKSYDSDVYTGVDLVKQRTLSMDEDWLKKVMNDLNDDQSGYYDYSHSHKL